jgi:hypothetical protein
MSSSFSSCYPRDESFSEICSGPFTVVPKILVGISDIKCQKGKTIYRVEASFIHEKEMSWSIWRRYSDFLQLRDDLFLFLTKCYFHHCPGCHALYRALQCFDFPRKRLITSKLKYTLKKRRHALDAFARLLSGHSFSSVPKCQLCSQEPFKKIKNFFFDPKLLIIKNSNKTFEEIDQEIIPQAFAPVNDPLKSKIEFRRGQYIYKIFQVEKPIFFTTFDSEQEKLEPNKKEQ